MGIDKNINHSYITLAEVRVARGGMLPVNWLLLRSLSKKR